MASGSKETVHASILELEHPLVRGRPSGKVEGMSNNQGGDKGSYDKRRGLGDLLIVL